VSGDGPADGAKSSPARTMKPAAATRTRPRSPRCMTNLPSLPHGVTPDGPQRISAPDRADSVLVAFGQRQRLALCVTPCAPSGDCRVEQVRLGDPRDFVRHLNPRLLEQPPPLGEAVRPVLREQRPARELAEG